ncbi:hypothetical protein [Litoreibacter arenae]|uniref:Uncharacterized protein n=1 Tax=Litoreibacter arenae DSM 19593 TaxID=1123360 RepID=S9QMV6_9RHOB|nr:hypothetical protein [Litoreibacter arenae]EPX80943.1 hypothetical protein thalar_00388 [Litoreibacter arenae DSM 19593]
MNQNELNPGERIDLLRDDLTDVAIWLKYRHSDENFVFVVDYFHHQKYSKEIAYVVILGPEKERRRAIRAAATLAIEALGWRIVPGGGGDVIDAQPDSTRDLSAHERLQAIGRVQNALDQTKRPN